MGGDHLPRIVVGVDGSEGGSRALRWALHQAESTGAAVEAVIVWDVPAPLGTGPTVLDGEDLAGTAQLTLETAVAASSAEHPAVAVDERVRRGHPGAVLVDEAKGADLLVVGSHRHGGLVTALLGSVSRWCTEHASCPVVVVRTDR